MTTFTELKTQADQLRTAGHFEEALPLYEQCWLNHRTECTKWEGWAYAHCLSKQNRYAEALDVCRDVYKLDPTFDYIRNLYAWAIYQTEIKTDSSNNMERFLKAANAILELTTQANSYAPYTRTVFEVIKHYKHPFKAREILHWLAKLDVNLLSAESVAYTDSSGKNREPASEQEEYYVALAKAQLETAQYQACLETGQLALKTLTQFHYNNDIWLQRNMAHAASKLGQADRALTLLKEILLRKRDWFIQQDIAEIYAQLGDEQQALAYALDAALNFGEIQMKINLYQLLAELLRQANKEDLARKHIALIYSIRQEQNWKIDDQLQRQAKAYQLEPEMLESSENAYPQLKQVWEKLKFENQTEFQGVIRTILPHGKAGFIETRSGESYYFKVTSFKEQRSKLTDGLAVRFYVEESFDAKKNRKSQVAINIRPQ